MLFPVIWETLVFTGHGVRSSKHCVLRRSGGPRQHRLPSHVQYRNLSGRQGPLLGPRRRSDTDRFPSCFLHFREPPTVSRVPGLVNPDVGSRRTQGRPDPSSSPWFPWFRALPVTCRTTDPWSVQWVGYSSVGPESVSGTLSPALSLDPKLKVIVRFSHFLL